MTQPYLSEFTFIFSFLLVLFVCFSIEWSIFKSLVQKSDTEVFQRTSQFQLVCLLIKLQNCCQILAVSGNRKEHLDSLKHLGRPSFSEVSEASIGLHQQKIDWRGDIFDRELALDQILLSASYTSYAPMSLCISHTFFSYFMQVFSSPVLQDQWHRRSLRLQYHMQTIQSSTYEI